MRNQVLLGRRTMRLVWGATAVAATLAAQLASAATIVVDFSSNPLSTVPFNLDGFYLNVVTGVASVDNFSGYDINPYFSGSTGSSPSFRLFLPSTGGVIGAGGIATPLAPGATVGAAGSFINGVTNANAATPGTNYFGFKFVNEGTSQTNYGYIVISQSQNPPFAGAVKVLGYAYENAGASLSVPLPVPEPATPLMMLAGLLAIGALRKRLARD